MAFADEVQKILDEPTPDWAREEEPIEFRPARPGDPTQPPISDEEARANIAADMPDNPLLRNVQAGATQGGLDILSMLNRLDEVFGLEEKRGTLVDKETGEERPAPTDTDLINEFTEIYEQAAQQRDKETGVPDIVEQSMRGAGRSLTQAGVYASTGMGVPAVIGGFMGSVANQTLSEGRKAGLEGDELARYVALSTAIEGAITSAFQLAGAGGFESAIGGKALLRGGIKKALKQAGVNTLSELSEENIIEILQNVNSAVHDVDPEAVTPANMMQTVMQTSLQTIMSMGMAEGTRMARGAEKDRAERKQAEAALKDEIARESFRPTGQQTETEQQAPKTLLEEEGLREWAEKNTDQAGELAEMGKGGKTPSRQDFNRLGLPKTFTTEERKQIAQRASEMVEPQQEIDYTTHVDTRTGDRVRVTESEDATGRSYQIERRTGETDTLRELPEVFQEAPATRIETKEGSMYVPDETLDTIQRLRPEGVAPTVNEVKDTLGKEFTRDDARAVLQNIYGENWRDKVRSKDYAVQQKETQEGQEEQTQDDLEGLTWNQLRQRAKSLGLKSVGVKKTDLIEQIRAKQQEQGPTPPNTVKPKPPKIRSKNPNQGKVSRKKKKKKKKEPAPPPEPEETTVTEEETEEETGDYDEVDDFENKVYKAYVKTREKPEVLSGDVPVGGVTLQKLRESMPDVDRNEFDRLITELVSRNEDYQLMRLEDPKDRTPKVVEGAVKRGGRQNHILLVESVAREEHKKKQEAAKKKREEQKQPNEELAQDVVQAAQKVKKEGRSGPDKVLISEAFIEFKKTHPDYTLKDFKEILPELSQKGLVEVGRAESIEDLDSNKVKASETKSPTGKGTWHFIRTPKGKPSKGGQKYLQNPQIELEKEIEGTGEKISKADVLETFKEEFDVEIRKGKVGSKKALGVYRVYPNKVKPRVIRIIRDKYGEFGVAAHEVAHDIDEVTDVLSNVPFEAQQELANLDYDKEAKRMDEGFAEFMRILWTREDAEQYAPRFHEYFTQEWMPRNPKMAKKIEKLKNIIDRYIGAGAKGRGGGMVSFTGKEPKPIGRSWGTWGRKFREWAWNKWMVYGKDEGYSLYLLEQNAKKRGHNPESGVYQLYSALMKTAPTYAEKAIQRGVFYVDPNKFNRKISGVNLKDSLSRIDPKEYEDFVLWAYSRHALEMYKKSREEGSKLKHPGLDEDDARAIFEENRDNQKWVEVANDLTQFNNDLIELLVDSGVIPVEDGERILNEYDFYLPLHRVPDPEKSKSLGSRIRGTLSADNKPVKGRHGNDTLPIIDPVQSTIERAMRFYDVALKQQVKNELVNTAKNAGYMGSWIEHVSPETRGTSVGVKEVLKSLKPETKEMVRNEGGIDIDNDILANLDDEVFATIWRPDFYANKGKPQVVILQDGKPEVYQVHKDLFHFIEGMDQYRLHPFLDMTLGFAMRTLKLGATGLNMSFAARNMVIDQLTFLVQSRESKVSESVDPFLLAGSYAWAQGKKIAGIEDNDPVRGIWEEMGGPLSHYLGLDRKVIRSSIEDIVGRHGYLANTGNVIKKTPDAIRNIVGISEVGPRLAEFRATLRRRGYDEQRIKKGEMPPRSVLVEAINNAHDVTTDFRRMGRWGKIANQIVPFFNAFLESQSKHMRTWRDNPTRAALGTMSFAAVGMLYWALNKDEDWYKERPDWLDAYWVITDDAGTPVIRIPKPREWGVIPTGVEHLLDRIYGNDPEAGDRFAQTVLRSFTIDLNPVLITPIVEYAANYDFFRERPVVSRSLQQYNPEHQFYSYNTLMMRGMAKHLADKFGVQVSPARMEHLLNGLTGGLYRNVARSIEGAVTGREEYTMADLPGIGGFILRDEYTRSIDDFYELREDIKTDYNSAKIEGESLEVLEPKHRKFQDYADLMSQLRDMARKPMKKSEKWKYSKYIVGLARDALGRPKLDRYPNPLTDRNAPEKVKKLRDDYLGRKVFDFTNPEFEDKGIESTERRQKQIRYAGKILVDLDMPQTVLKETLKKEYADRYNIPIEQISKWDGTRRSAFGERLQRLENRL